MTLKYARITEKRSLVKRIGSKRVTVLLKLRVAKIQLLIKAALLFVMQF